MDPWGPRRCPSCQASAVKKGVPESTLVGGPCAQSDREQSPGPVAHLPLGESCVRTTSEMRLILCSGFEKPPRRTWAAKQKDLGPSGLTRCPGLQCRSGCGNGFSTLSQVTRRGYSAKKKRVLK